MGDEISVDIRRLEDGDYGMWGEDFMHMLIDANKAPIEKIDTIIHELCHYMEGRMIRDKKRKRGVSHHFINEASTCIAIILGKYGLLKNITPSEAEEYEKQLTVNYWVFPNDK